MDHQILFQIKDLRVSIKPVSILSIVIHLRIKPVIPTALYISPIKVQVIRSFQTLAMPDLKKAPAMVDLKNIQEQIATPDFPVVEIMDLFQEVTGEDR